MGTTLRTASICATVTSNGATWQIFLCRYNAKSRRIGPPPGPLGRSAAVDAGRSARGAGRATSSLEGLPQVAGPPSSIHRPGPGRSSGWWVASARVISTSSDPCPLGFGANLCQRTRPHRMFPPPPHHRSRIRALRSRGSGARFRFVGVCGYRSNSNFRGVPARHRRDVLVRHRSRARRSGCAGHDLPEPKGSFCRG